MTDYLLLFVGTVLVNNFVLVKFLGLCPFMGVSKSWKRPLAWASPPHLLSHWPPFVHGW